MDVVRKGRTGNRGWESGRGIAGVEKRGEDRRGRERERGKEVQRVLGEIVQGQIDKGVL